MSEQDNNILFDSVNMQFNIDELCFTVKNKEVKGKMQFKTRNMLLVKMLSELFTSNMTYGGVLTFETQYFTIHMKDIFVNNIEIDCPFDSRIIFYIGSAKIELSGDIVGLRQKI